MKDVTVFSKILTPCNLFKKYWILMKKRHFLSAEIFFLNNTLWRHTKR